MKFSNNKFDYFLITAIFLAALLHIFLIDFHPLALDELLTLRLLEMKDLNSILTYLKINDTQMPLYYILMFKLHNLNLIPTPALARFPSFLFYILGLIIHYKTLHRIKGKSIALTSTALMSFSFVLLLHSVEVRMYTLMFLLLACSNYFFFLLLKKPHFETKTFAGFLIFGVLATTAHFFGLIYFATTIFLLFLKLKKEKKLSTFVLLVLLTALTVLLVLTVPFIIKNFNTYHAYRPAPSIKDFLGVVSYLFSGSIFLGVLILSSFIQPTLLKQSKKFLETYWGIILIVSFPITLTFLKSWVSAPVFEARYFIGSVSPFYMLLAIYIHETNWRFKFFARGLTVTLMLISLYHIIGKENFLKHPYRLDTKGIAEIIKDEREKNTAINIISCNTCPDYYLKNIKLTCIWEDGYKSMSDNELFDPTLATLLIENTYPKANCEKVKQRFKKLTLLNDKKIKWVNFYLNY